MISGQFSDKIDETWVDVMITCMQNDISLNSVLLTFEDDYHLRWKDKYKLL